MSRALVYFIEYKKTNTSKWESFTPIMPGIETPGTFWEDDKSYIGYLNKFVNIDNTYHRVINDERQGCIRDEVSDINDSQSGLPIDVSSFFNDVFNYEYYSDMRDYVKHITISDLINNIKASLSETISKYNDYKTTNQYDIINMKLDYIIDKTKSSYDPTKVSNTQVDEYYDEIIEDYQYSIDSYKTVIQWAEGILDMVSFITDTFFIDASNVRLIYFIA